MSNESSRSFRSFYYVKNSIFLLLALLAFSSFRSADFHNYFSEFESVGLPVDLSKFDINIIRDKVVLKWRTNSEIKNKGYEVQRSYDGRTWRSLDFIGGGGSTTLVRNYEYVDYPNPGIVHYRLRQVDWNGQFDLSSIKTVTINAENDCHFVGVYPNPVEEKEISLFFPNGIEVIAFYQINDSYGRIIYKGAIGPGKGNLENKLNISKLSSNGVYYLTVSSGNFQETIKLLIN